MSPLVSILIPCSNAAPWLAATLASALAQTHPRTEIIIVDDGSSDHSLAIARTFEPHGVRVVTQPNAGASAARNHARRRRLVDTPNTVLPRLTPKWGSSVQRFDSVFALPLMR
jgi:glycosyltransferase involved in cell wall biosynthesis